MQRHRGDDDDVAPREQRAGGRVPQPLDLVVDRRVLLDVGVRLRDVRLGLVVVVVRDEVLDRVVRQQLAELRGQLRGERLVGRHHERRPLHLLDEPGRRRRLAGAGGAEQHDVLLARLDPRRQLRDRRRLVARRRVLGDHLEGRDGPLEIGDRTHATTVRGTTDTRVGRGQARVPARTPGTVRGGRRARRAARAVQRRRRPSSTVHRRCAGGSTCAGVRGTCTNPLRTSGPRGEQVLQRVERRVADVQARRCSRPRPARPCSRTAGSARLDRERREERGRCAGDHRDVDRRRRRRCRGSARR